jgi:peptidoglycan/LPS O-acetylase OafA/YrhL
VAFICAPLLLRLALKLKPIRFDPLAGYLAHGIFLAHLPVIRLMHARENSFADFFVALTVSTVIAIALHFAVEPRVLALRHRGNQDPPDLKAFEPSRGAWRL